MRRISIFAGVFLCASLLMSTGCKPKTDNASALEEETTDAAAVESDDSEDAQADQDAAENSDEPVIEIDAPKEGLLGGQGLRDPQEGQDDSADDGGGLKLQLGGGSGYGYQGSQPSLLND